MSFAATSTLKSGVLDLNINGETCLANKRSKEARERRKLKRKQRLSDHEQATSLLLRYSWRDQINGESVFTQEMCRGKDGKSFSFKTLIELKLAEQFGDGYPVFPLDHEYGEVLNRFEMSVPVVHSYVRGR